VFNSDADRDQVTFEEVGNPPSIDDLDRPITREEIEKAVNNLKNNKSPGPDGVLAEMLKNALGTILPFLESLFNQIFNSGEYPELWTGAIIVPLHKSGDKNVPNNYRGVSLLSILGKVFAQILNRRLSNWAEDNHKIVEEQGGFRAGHSTADNIFVLYGIVQRYLTKHVCFVDFQKAFDVVNRTVLWNVLRRAGIGGKMLRILQNMYSRVKSCVRCPSTLTEYFECPIGVRQGCALSPTLFSFLINELAIEISQNGKFGVQLNPDIVQVLIMLFADDVILASYCATGLQTQINILKQYADSFSMTVNLSKTKIIVFRKGGFLGAREVWWYGDKQIEVVNNYKYLGLCFSTKLSLTQAISELATKAKQRTVQILKCLWKLGTIDFDVFFKIYDAQVIPVIMYGSELWGYQRFDMLEKAHLYACKRLLNVGPTTPNALVLGDTGRMPIFVLTAARCVKYWLRVLTLQEDRLPRKVYNMMYHFQEQGRKTWAFHIKELLCTNGFGVVWIQQGVGDVQAFLRLFRQRMIDQYKQNWHSDIQTSERFSVYSSFKTVFQRERYVQYEQKRCFKDCYVQFRFGISPLNVHRERYNKNCTQAQLLCPSCKTETETEEHVLFRCLAYKVLRDQVHILTVDQPSRRTVKAVMAADDERTVVQLSRYLYHIFQKRKQVLVT